MRRGSWLLLGAGLAGSLVAFAGAFDNPLRDDDLVFLGHVIAHPSLPDLLRPSPSFAFYRPGALLLFLLEHRLFGFEGGHYLFVNYLLHIAIAVAMLMRYLYFAAVPACALIALLVTSLHERSGSAGRLLLGAGVCALVAVTLLFEITLEHKYDRYARQPKNQEELQLLAGPTSP